MVSKSSEMLSVFLETPEEVNTRFSFSLFLLFFLFSFVFPFFFCGFFWGEEECFFDCLFVWWLFFVLVLGGAFLV